MMGLLGVLYWTGLAVMLGLLLAIARTRSPLALALLGFVMAAMIASMMTLLNACA
jgi:predicted anti-sigma-YlaC factor YlaD